MSLVLSGMGTGTGTGTGLRGIMEAFDLRCWSGNAQVGLDFSQPAIVDHITIDSRRIESNHTLFVALKGSQSDGHEFVSAAAKAGARYALVRKDWHAPENLPITLLRVPDPLLAFQDIVKAYLKGMKAKIVCITGSYGKTMVKDLLYSMVATSFSTIASPESFNSQIGVPLSLLQIQPQHAYALIEAGISKPGEMSILSELVQPRACILTHIGRKHQSSLGDLQMAAREFSYMLQATDEWVLYPKQFQETKKIKADRFIWNGSDQVLPHAVARHIDEHGYIHYRVSFPTGETYDSFMTGGYKYFLDLINLTIKAAWLLGITSINIQSMLKEYIPEPMRTEIWKLPYGPTFINDMYCSDPQSIDTALLYLSQAPHGTKKTFVFSGLRTHKQKLDTDYQRIRQSIVKANVDSLLLVGPHQLLMERIKEQAPSVHVSQFECHADVFKHLKGELSSEDYVLFKGKQKLHLDALVKEFNDSYDSNQCFINLAAIQANLTSIQAKVGRQTRIMVMVKALAYGTNDIQMSKYLARLGVDILGVSYVEEGVTLKRAGVQQSIFVINAAPYEVAKVVKWNLEVGVSDLCMIEALAQEAEKQNKKIRLHVHVNTGMGRFGCRPEEALGLCSAIIGNKHLTLEGIMTHFACAEDPQQDDFTMQQARILETVIGTIERSGIHIPWKHAANSAASVRFHFPSFNMARIGLAMYGLYSSEATKEAIDLQLALSMISRIVGINHCKAGETISYGRNYTVQKDEQKIAVLPIGYFDGLHRNYSGKAHVMIKGLKAPMIGNICMDYMMVDVTDIPHAKVGDPVLIFGEDEYGNFLSPEDLAAQGNSIVHELITCLGPRIQRIFIHEEKLQVR